MSILREIFVKLGLDVDEAAFASGNIAAEVLKKSFEKVVESAQELAHQFVENIEATAEYGDRIIELGAATGIGTKSLQQLGKAAAEEGIGIDEISKSIILLSKNMASAKDGSEETKKAFKQAGAQFVDSTGKLRPAEDVFVDVSEGFHNMEDGAEKTALAMKLFGKSGAQMIDFLNRGKDDLGEYFEMSVMSDEQLKAGKEVVEMQRALTAQTRALWKSAVAPLLPAIRDLLKQYLDWKKVNNDVMKQNITAVAKAGIAVVRGLGQGFLFLVGTIKFFRDNWKIVAVVVTAGLAGWAAANTLLIAQWGIMAVSAVIAAGTAAAAWMAAAAPFILIGGVLAGIILLFDDLREYNAALAAGGTGKNTMFGQLTMGLQKWEAEFYKSGQPKPAWLIFLELARDALEEMRKSVKFIEEFFDKPGQIAGEVTSGSWRRFKGMFTDTESVPQDVGGLTEKEKRWRQEAQGRMYAGIGDQSVPFTPFRSEPTQEYRDRLGQQFYTPAPSLPAYGGGSSSSVSQSTQLTFQISGGNPAEVRRVIGEELQSRGVVTVSELEAGAAAASYSQP